MFSLSNFKRDAHNDQWRNQGLFLLKSPYLHVLPFIQVFHISIHKHHISSRPSYVFFSINTIMHLNRKSYYTVHAKYSSHYTAYSSKTFLQNTIKSITSFHQNYIILWCICTSRPTLIPANKLQCTKLVETLRKHSQASIPNTIYKSVRDRPVIETLFRVSVDIFSTP